MQYTPHVDVKCICASHYISPTLNTHTDVSSAHGCVCVCMCINNGRFVGWGGNASANAELVNRGRKQAWRWLSKTEGKRNKRKEGKEEQEADRGLPQRWRCGRWVKKNVNSYSNLTEESPQPISVYLPVPRHRGFKGLPDHIVIHPQVLCRIQY